MIFLVELGIFSLELSLLDRFRGGYRVLVNGGHLSSLGIFSLKLSVFNSFRRGYRVLANGGYFDSLINWDHHFRNLHPNFSKCTKFHRNLTTFNFEGWGHFGG